MPSSDNPAAIGPGQYRIEIKYAGLSLAAPEKVRFKRRLEGLERAWVDVGTERLAGEIGSGRADGQTDVLAAGDEASLEAIRVAALGKKGSISELLKTLGAMSPDERKVQGPLLNGLRDSVGEAIAARKAQLGDAALEEAVEST